MVTAFMRSLLSPDESGHYEGARAKVDLAEAERENKWVDRFPRCSRRGSVRPARWAPVMKNSLSMVLRRAGTFFMRQSPIHRAARRIAATLTAMNIPFAVAGALAANAHGHVRTTDDVHILLRPEGLRDFKQQWLGRGWVEKFAGSKGIRDTTNNVDIDVLLSGEYPGDGLPKPVAFPDPAAAAEADDDGVPILSLRALVELKLASGMTAPDRPRDLDDVIQLIRANQLPRDYAGGLNPYVQAKYDELWVAAQHQDEY